MPTDKELFHAIAKIVEKSQVYNQEIGRLGIPNGSGYTITVPGRPNEVYISKGDSGEGGPTTAIDRAGVAHVANQKVWMVWERDKLVIIRAEQYAGGSSSTTLGGLTDVTITAVADGNTLQYDSATSQWINVVPAGGAGGAPSPHDLSGVHHSGLLAWADLDKTGSDLADLASRAHSDLTGIGVNDHHNQVHVLATNVGLGGDHTISGATAGHVLRASSSSAAAFAQLQHTDLGGILPDQHHDPVTVGNTGLSLSTQVVSLQLAAVSGLQISSGLMLADSVAGDGINITNKVMDIVAADTTMTILPNGIRVNQASNFDWTGVHTFADDVTFNAPVILNSNGTFNTGVFRFNTDPQINANLDFIGGDRLITASNNLTISPTTDLILDPTGLILLGAASGQELRTPTYNDFVAGIAGLRHWDTGGNVRQLTIGKIKADELFVRVFTADEARVNRGEEFWTRSFGIVETAFTVPADEATVDVWFEEAPGLGSFKLFLPDNWILIRSIDWTTGLVVQAIWFQVVDADGAGTNDYISRVAMNPLTDSRPSRQQWRLRRKSGGLTGTVIKAGETAVDFGKPFSVTSPTPGQGVVHLSALAQDGGPFVQIQTFESVSSDVPQFKNRVRMGNLTGTVDYSSDIFGFAAGDDLSKTPSTGFSGMAAEATNGLRLFNTSLAIYDASTLELMVSKDYGIRMLEADSAVFENRKFIAWYSDLADTGLTDLTAGITMATAIGTGEHYLRFVKNAHATQAGTDVNGIILLVQTNSPTTLPASGPRIIIENNQVTGVDSISLSQIDEIILGSSYVRSSGIKVGSGGAPTGSPASLLHVYENTANIDTTTGVTIEQDGAGDAVLQWLLTGGTRIFAGIDNTDGTWKLSSGAHLGASTWFAINPSTSIANLYTSLEVRDGFEAGGSGTSTAGDLVVDPAAKMTYVGRLSGTGGDSSGFQLRDRLGGVYFEYNPSVGNVLSFVVPAAALAGVGTASAVSKLHVYQDNANTGTNIGITVEQDGTGDAVVQYLLTGGQRWVTGVDNSVSGDPFVISPAADLTNGVFSLAADGKLSLTGGVTSSNDGLLQLVLGNAQNSGINITNTASATADIWLQLRGGSPTPIWWTIGMDRSESNALIFSTSNVLSTSGPLIISRTGEITVGGGITPELTTQLDVHAEAQHPIRASLYGAAQYNFLGRRALTSKASPSAVANGTVLMALGGIGYASSGWHTHVTAEIDFVATENYTSTGRGGRIQMFVTKNLTTTRSLGLEIGDDRQFYAPGVDAHLDVGGTANVSAQATSGWLRKISSSERYKQDIRPLDTSVDLISKIMPVIYRPRQGYGDTSRIVPGFIAEQVAAVGGGLFVTYDESGRPQSVMYDRLIVLAISEIQALKQRIVELEKGINL